MKSKFEIEELDWISDDPINKDNYYVNQGRLFRSQQLDIEEVLNSTNSTNYERLYTNNTESIKFSSLLSGKNTIIHGGGTIATLGNCNAEDYAVVEGLNPKGIAYIEFICPISCQGMMFGMCNVDRDDMNNSNILNIDKKNFGTFRTTSRRRVGMEIDYDKRIVRFFLEGVLKEKTLEFNTKSIYPCIILMNKSTSIILNTFGKHNDLNFPFGLMSNSRNEEFLNNSLSNYLFIVNVPKIDVDESFSPENYFSTHYNLNTVDGLIVANRVYIPIDKKTKKLCGFIAVLFENKKIIEKFKTNQIKLTKYLDNSVIKSLVSKNIIKNYNLLKLSQKEIKANNINLTIRRLCNLNDIVDDEDGIVRWFIKEYENLDLTNQGSMNQLLDKIQTAIIQTKSKLSSNDHPQKMNNKDSNIKIEYLPYYDRFLLIDNANVKLFARNKQGAFDFFFYNVNSYGNNKTGLIFENNELVTLLDNIPWKTLLYDAFDDNTIVAISYFFDSLLKKVQVNLNYCCIPMKNKIARKFIETIISFLNKSIYLVKEKVKIMKSLSEIKQKETNYDMEIDSSLPFSTQNENEIDNLQPNDINSTEFIHEYTIRDTESTFSMYKCLIQIYEQVYLNSNNQKDKKSSLNQSPRCFSSLSRLSTFVNYPFPDKLKFTELTDKGLYVDNTLSNELKLYGHDKVSILGYESIKDTESLDRIINQQFPFNLINKTNIWPNIDIAYSINVSPSVLQIDPKNNEPSSVSVFSKLFAHPLILTASDNGCTFIWNYTLGMNKISTLNVKKGLKTIVDFKDIKEIKWLRSETPFLQLTDVLSDDKFKSVLPKDIDKIPEVPNNSMLPKEKEVNLNQEMINNLYIMGFPLEACKFALKESKNNFDKALEFLLEKTGDPEFMKSFAPKEIEKDSKINPWECEECTFFNEKHEFSCEICGTAIPANILKEQMALKQRIKQEDPIEHKIVEKITRMPEENIVEFKDCRIINSHIIYDNNDPAAPFIVATVLFDVILNKLIVSYHKLMINPTALRDFILITNEGYQCRIDNKKFIRIEDVLTYLNEKHFINIHTLYPSYVGPSNFHSGFYRHLIPIEHTYTELPVISIFDSFSFESNLSVIVESKHGQISLLNFSLKNKFKFENISNKSLEIEYKSFDNVQEYLTDSYPIELKIFRDNLSYFIVSKDNILEFDKDYKLKNTFSFYKSVSLFKKVNALFDNQEITEIKVYDDINGHMSVKIKKISHDQDLKHGQDLNNNLLSKDDKDSNLHEIKTKIAALKVEEFNYSELNVLAQLLEFERINIQLDGKDLNKYGIISDYTCDVKGHNSLINQFKKIYIDTRHLNSQENNTTIEFYEASINTVTNFEFFLKVKNKHISLKSSDIINSEVSDSQMNTPLESITEIKNLIPLTIVDYKGSQSQLNVNVSSILFGEDRFTTNYSNPQFLFSHLHGNILDIESFIIGSELGSKVGEVPFGEGLIFLINDLQSISLAEEYSRFTQTDFKDFLELKRIKNEEIFEWEPFCYVMMSEKKYVRVKVQKRRLCKYIYFIPTNARTVPKDFTNVYENRSISLVLFAAEGIVMSSKQEDSQYLNQFTENILENNKLSNETSFKLVLKGLPENSSEYLKLNKTNCNNITINGLIPNTYSKLNDTDILISKLSISNSLLSDRPLKKLLISLSAIKSDINYEILGFTIESLTFKSLDKDLLKECINLRNLDIYELRRVIVEKDNFSFLNKKFVELLSLSEINENKRLSILNYLKCLISHIPTISVHIEESLDYIQFIKLNILQSTTSELINTSLDYIRSIKITENISKAIVNILENFSILEFSQPGFKSFVSLFSLVNMNDSLLMPKIIKIISFSLNCIKDKQLQTTSNIYLKTHLKLDETPFDTKIFTQIKNESVEFDNHIINNMTIPTIQTCVLAEISKDTLNLKIDLYKVHKVQKLRLLFKASEANDSHFKIHIWGSESIKEGYSYKLLKSKYYLDNTWKQLTKYQTLLQSNPNMFSLSDIRTLEIDDLDFTGRYMQVNISLSQGENQIREFPTSLYIAPQVIGEISMNSENYEDEKFSEKLDNFKSIKSEILTFAKRFKFTLKLNMDTTKYLLIQDTECGDISLTNSELSVASLDLPKLMYNLKLFQGSLEKIISDIFNRREAPDTALQSKIKTLNDDISCIQLKIKSKVPLVDLSESLSVNLNILLTLIKFLENKGSKNPLLMREIFNNIENKSDFIINLIEVCILNNYGELFDETLKVIRGILWKSIFETESDPENFINNIFHQIINKYLTKDVFYRSALHTIEALSSINFGVDIILTKLKESFSRKWNEDEIPDAFYNISSLIILLIMKIRNKDSQIGTKCVQIINVNLDFIKYLTKSSKFMKEINDIILAQSLNLMQECVNSIDIGTLNKIINPELIDYLVSSMFDMWDNNDIKSKIMVIVDKLVNPFTSKLPENELKQSKLLSDRITINTQILTINYIQELLDTDETDDSSNDDRINKLDYVFNLLIKTYTINSDLSLKIKNTECPEIKERNSEIIEKFIKIALKFNNTNKIGCSAANNFWKYLINILERGNLSMMFYNNIFSRLILNSFLNLDVNMQEMLSNKFIRVFESLYNKESDNSKTTEILDQVVDVILHIIKHTSGTEFESITFPFVTSLCDIVLSGQTPMDNNFTILASTSTSAANQLFKVSSHMKNRLFNEVSTYLVQYVNVGSFTGCISSNKIVYDRSALGKVLMNLVSTFMEEYLDCLNKKEMNEEFSTSIRNYLIILIFNNYNDITSQPLVLCKVAKILHNVNSLIEMCSKRKILIEVMLSELMKAVRKIDEQVFICIKSNKISLKKAIIILDKLFTNLEVVLNKSLHDDEITKFFAFELQGFKFFIDRVNTYRKNVYISSSNNILRGNFDLNADLLKSLTHKGISSSSVISGLNSNDINKKLVDDEGVYNGDLSDYVYEEFAVTTKLVLMEGDEQNPNLISNVNWSGKKKGANSHVLTRDMKGGTYFEESFLFNISHLVDVKDIFIGFNFNITNIADRLAGIIPCVYLEAGTSLDKMDICVKLQRIEDNVYIEKGVIVYGFNFYSFSPELVKLDENYISNVIGQLINCKARYFRFVVRRPYLLSNENSHTAKLNSNQIVVGINHVSIYGSKIADRQKVLEFIQEKEKNVSIKIISKIFTAEFIDTLKYIANDTNTIDNIKNIYDAFEPYINQHANILSNILINVSKYNFELGEWLLNRLLNSENSEIHAKLAVEITQNNVEYLNERINKYLCFILRELTPTSHLFFSHDLDKKLKNLGKFSELFAISLNGLLISPFITKPIELNLDFDQYLSIIKNLDKYSIISTDILKLITLLLIPNKKLKLNKFLDPEEAVFLLNELYLNSYVYEYLEILSYLVANNELFEKICFKKKLLNFYCDEFINQVNNGIRGKNMLALMNVLKNMSFSQIFVQMVRDNNYDFTILHSIKNNNNNSDSILINNNSNFLVNLVVFMRNCIINYPECHKRLADILIDDLEICKKKIDKTYANNVLMPLLRMEKVVNVCIHPLDSFFKTLFSTYCNVSHVSAGNKVDEKSVSGVGVGVDRNLKSLKSNEYLPDSNLPSKVVSTFKELFTKFEYEPKKNFPSGNFIKVFSSKSCDNLKDSTVFKAISNQSQFLIIMYPSETSGEEIFTFFYCNGTIPNLTPLTYSNSSESELNTLNIPYTSQNFMGQINGDDYISCRIIPEYDDSNGKDYEIVTIINDSYNSSIGISGQIIKLYLTLSQESCVDSYMGVLEVFKSKGMSEICYISSTHYEIYTLNTSENSQNVVHFSNVNNAKIISTKYIDETGNLDYERVKMMKYYKNNHPLLSVRNNPILEIPFNITNQLLREFLISNNANLKLLSNQETIKEEMTMADLLEYTQNSINTNIVDISYDIQMLRGNLVNSELPLISLPNYEPKLPIFEAFEKNNGIRKIVSVLKNSIAMWKSKDAIESWIKWIDDVEKFSELSSFFSTLIRHQKCLDIIFNLLCGVYDNDTSFKEIGIEAKKYIYDILNDLFISTQNFELRKISIEKGIFNSIMEKLQFLTRENSRKYSPGNNSVVIPEIPTESTTTKEGVNNASALKDSKSKKTVNKKGVGYGSDHTGDNKTWDVNMYIEGKKSNSIQIASIINLLTNFFNTKELKMTEELNKCILESPLLPVLESAFRSSTLLELAKEDSLYYAYLNMTVKLSESPQLIRYLLDISQDYKPIQISSIFNLLSGVNDGAKIFASCIKTNSDGEKSVEEKLALEIIRSYDIVCKNIKSYQSNIGTEKNYGEILKLPVENSYPLLMRELSFNYMSMKGANNKIVHYYASSMSGDTSSTKMIRLAQEYADLSRSLPCEHTNAIFIRVDQDNMDVMKALIMGSAGTPYGHGAFEFDIYFDSQYPNGPPKVNLMTTGASSVRFNPNLYANGKVCLSLLGTWRGQSTENWDAKISTLLQVLISIQSIIMSDLVYFNEPSCESEIGKPEGEAKNEGYSNIVRYCNVKYAMIEQIKNPSKGFEEVIRRHFYLKKDIVLKEVKGWIERSKTADAKYSSFSYDHNPTWAQKMTNKANYTKMMEEIYVELEKELNNLPLPSELKKKTEESEKIASEKQKKNKMEFISLEDVDVTYDNENIQSKEININDDAVKDRWSRYIGAMGIDAVKRQANSSVFLSGASGLGIEIAKNIVLSGCKKFVLHDTKKANYFDLSSQFFLNEEDIGKNRAEGCIKKLQQLNHYVKILASSAFLPKEEIELDKFGLKDFNIVILTQCDYETQIIINKYCRKREIQFISTDVYGVFGRVINDFGDKFIVNDKDGEELKDCMIKNISESVVTVLENTRHNFQDGDEVIISEVEGMKCLDNFDKNINGTKHKVTVINPQSFKIGDTSVFTEYIRNGMAKQIKSTRIMEYKDLEYVLNNENLLQDENMSISDFTKISHSVPIHIAFNSLDIFYKLNKNLPQPWSISDSSLLLSYAKTLSTKYKLELSEKDERLIRYVSFTAQAQLPPLCAFFGGIVAQESIKAMTGKFTPINQLFYYDAIEVLPDINLSNLEESVKLIDFENKKHRSDGLQMMIGRILLNKINSMKILVVGAGAIGCELLKNFAMLEVGTSGSIVVTDPDIIEVSNLTRQFLFREKHLRQPKSATAAAAIIQMNKYLKNHVFARLDKVWEETENIFNDKFISELSVVCNALDNITARRYVDSRCVTNRIPLLESGTLGPKGHVQVVIPYKTESYSSQQDPEVTNDIPQCTLKMFPEEAMHCVEWARDRFGKYFTQKPKSVNKFIEEFSYSNTCPDMKLIKQVIKYLKKSPVDFNDCIRLAREKFQKLFYNNIKQLLFVYPQDKKNNDGKLFWSLPKRLPLSVEYDSNNNMHVSFIAAYSCLLANQFKIKIPYENPRKETSKLEIALKAVDIKLPEFIPNELKANEMIKQVENEKKQVDGIKKEDINNNENVVDLNLDQLTTEYKELSVKFNIDKFNTLTDKEKREKEFTSEEFEKDNDSNYHIDLIHSMTNLRCLNYKLDLMDWIQVKIKAGKIMPALATTTAAIAGLQSLELIKVMKNSVIEDMRNSFINIAIPYVQASEPGAVSNIKLKDDLTVNLWDRWEVKPQHNTLSSVFEFLKSKYGLYPRDCFKGKKAIYIHTAYEGEENKSQKEEILNKNLKTLLGDEEYVDVMITFTVDQNSDVYLKNVPVVRIILEG